MAKDKMDLEWFPLKWQKFIIGTSDMKADEIGGYILLLIREWHKGFLPEDLKELSKISKLSSKKLSKVLEKFENIDGKLYNETLEIIRIEQEDKANKNSIKGAKGAKARWDKYRLSKAQAMPEHSLTDSIRLEENRLEEEKNYINIDGEQIFEIGEWFEKNLKLMKSNWQRLFPLANIDNCLNDFFLKKSCETFKDVNHFKNSFALELKYIQEKNEKEKNSGKKEKGKGETLMEQDAELKKLNRA